MLHIIVPLIFFFNLFWNNGPSKSSLLLCRVTNLKNDNWWVGFGVFGCQIKSTDLYFIIQSFKLINTYNIFISSFLMTCCTLVKCELLVSYLLQKWFFVVVVFFFLLLFPQQEGVKTENNDHINLKVAGQDGSVVQFKIKRHTPLSKLMKAYCERQVRFLYDHQGRADLQRELNAVKSENCVNMPNDKHITETICVALSVLFLGSVIGWTGRVVTGNGWNKDLLLSLWNLHYRCRLLGGGCYSTAQKYQYGRGALETRGMNSTIVEW